MATITLNDDKIKLMKTNFIDVNELLTHLLSFWTSKIEFEEFNDDEKKYLNNRSSKIKSLEESINLIGSKI